MKSLSILRSSVEPIQHTTEMKRLLPTSVEIWDDYVLLSSAGVSPILLLMFLICILYRFANSHSAMTFYM